MSDDYSLDMVYYLEYFQVMFCMCDDSDIK
jgi:hypothetical protein